MSISKTDTPRAQVSQEDFREAMAGICSPVSVVTTLLDGMPYGTTVSAFASLSLEPAMVLVSLDKTSALLSVILSSGSFGLNVLGEGHSETALAFARKGGPSKFDGASWKLDSGVPRLPQACSFLACDVAEFVEGGDHMVLFGIARAADATPMAPLTYYRRSFGTHVAA